MIKHCVFSDELNIDPPKQIKAARKGKAVTKKSPDDPVCVSVFVSQIVGCEAVEHNGKGS